MFSFCKSTKVAAVAPQLALEPVMSTFAIPSGRSSARRLSIAGRLDSSSFIGRERRVLARLLWREFVGMFGVVLALIVAVFA